MQITNLVNEQRPQVSPFCCPWHIRFSPKERPGPMPEQLAIVKVCVRRICVPNLKGTRSARVRVNVTCQVSFP